MMADKARELLEELRTVLTGRSNLVDSIIPPLLFVLVNALLGFQAAMIAALALAALIALLRLRRGQSPGYALAGVAGVLLAFLIVRVLGREEGFFLPGIVTGALTVVVAVASVLARRPLTAWSSYLVRRWPLDWYWHPRVRPAYTEVTWLWAIFFGLRLLLQTALFRRAAADLLALFNVLSGWPATIVLLVISYLYGTWRLRNLGGPSVEEFEAGAEPPWSSQRRGF